MKKLLVLVGIFTGIFAFSGVAGGKFKALRPKILYPYHYGNTETSRIVDLLKGEKGIEVRIRKMM